MGRFLIVYIVCVFASAANAQLCDGRYAAADDLIEATYSRYGTLYSGGSGNVSVGPTLEIYRLLQGLPDSGMAIPRDQGAEYIDPPMLGYDGQTGREAGEILMRSLPRLHDPSFRRDTPEGSTDIEILLNRLTTIGPYAGWWLAPDAPHLSDVEKVIAQYAVDDGLDWLLSVQAASARPHQTAWYLQRHTIPRDMGTALTHAADRYLETQSLAWLVALETLQEGGSYGLGHKTSEALAATESRIASMREAVAKCTASPAEYVAASIGGYETLRQAGRFSVNAAPAMTLPPTLRRMAAVQIAKLGIRRQGYYGGDEPNHADLIALAGDPNFAAWHNVGRSYQAESIDALIAIHDGAPLDPKTYRLLNLLSANDMLTFAASREDGSDNARDLTSIAFLRLFALGRDDEAEALIDDLQRLWPDRANLMSENWDSRGSRGVRLARVALSLPEPRTLVVPPWNGWQDRGAYENEAQADHGLNYWTRARRSRDIPIAMRTGGFLNRDLRFWLQAIGSDPYAGYSVSRRTYRRGIIDRDIMDSIQPLVPQSQGHYGGLGIAGWAAWDELSKLGPETGLANRIGREIILNARAQSRSILHRWSPQREPIAAELELVIRQGRRMIHGTMDGEPLGKVAFELMYRSYGSTEASSRTLYWFTCRERCEP